MQSKQLGRQRRHERIRKKVVGTGDRPRLSVYRSLNHIYTQIIDDLNNKTIDAASSLDGSIRTATGHKGNCRIAKEVGALIAKKAQEKGVKRVVFDRGGYLYHGRVKALADAAREAGLDF